PKRCASSSIARLYPEPAGRRPGESVFPAANRGPSSRAATVSKGSAAPVRSVREIARSSFFQARSYSNGQYRAAHAAAARYTCVTRTPHLAIRINDDKTEIARRLDRRGGGAYTTGQNSLVRRLRAGIPRPDRSDARQRHADRAESEDLPELLPAPLGPARRRPRRALDLRLHHEPGRRRAEQ